MVDFLDSAGRSERMSRIKSRDTKPEMLLRRALHGRGLRYRLGGAALPGKPDLVLPRHRTAIFVHGCFWHRHSDCKVASTPKSNVEFWLKKFAQNVERDARNEQQLKELGWRVLIVWECELTAKSRLATTANNLKSIITG